MGIYTFTMDQRKVRFTDKPTLTGELKDQSGSALSIASLVAATITIAKSPRNVPQIEAAVDFVGSAWRYNFPNQTLEEGRGNVYFRVFPLMPEFTATLAANIDDTQTAIELTVSEGIIPAKGWIRIANEVMSFVKVDDSNITVVRNVFSTEADSHLQDDIIYLTDTSITCEYSLPLDFYEMKVVL